MNISHWCSLRMLVFWYEFCIKIFWHKNSSLFSESRNFYLAQQPHKLEKERIHGRSCYVLFCLSVCVVCEPEVSARSFSVSSTLFSFWVSLFWGLEPSLLDWLASKSQWHSGLISSGLDFQILRKITGDSVFDPHAFMPLPTEPSLKPGVAFLESLLRTATESQRRTVMNATAQVLSLPASATEHIGICCQLHNLDSSWTVPFLRLGVQNKS